MNPIRMLRNLSTIKQDQSLLLRFFSQISHNSSETVATTVKISDGSTNKNNHDCFGSSKILVSRKYMSKAPNTYLNVLCNKFPSVQNYEDRRNITLCHIREQLLESQPANYTPINKIINPFKLVEDDLTNLFAEIRQELKTSLPQLEEISTYYFTGEGKTIRPLIIILMAKAMNYHLYGSSNLLDSQKRVALVIEMIHTASLIHDDVIDSADTRRGKPSVNVIWGDKKSIFAGDYVISKGSQMLTKLNDPILVSIVSEAIIDLVLGEFMQMGSKKEEKMRFKHYLQKTYKKTASLISNTCKAVTYLATSNQKLQQAAFQYGKSVGIAFQLVDDLLDFVSSQAELGKPAANDLKLGLATAPVLFASEKFPEINDMIARRFCEPGDVEYAFDAVLK
ncbi:hypothetical protein SSS_01865 [Sarcoptes scabiei]|nr:hypothetical protein SSS_01865 [Sarcoptes scabiei]